MVLTFLPSSAKILDPWRENKCVGAEFTFHLVFGQMIKWLLLSLCPHPHPMLSIHTQKWTSLPDFLLQP